MISVDCSNRTKKDVGYERNPQSREDKREIVFVLTSTRITYTVSMLTEWWPKQSSIKYWVNDCAICGKVRLSIFIIIL